MGENKPRFGSFFASKRRQGVRPDRYNRRIPPTARAAQYSKLAPSESESSL